MATGYEQARSVAAALAGDLAAADEVMLELPETGVCSTDFAAPGDGAACCGGPALKDETACCARDEAMKPAGGCGCGSKPVSKPKAACCA
jgi:hypothetical protein